MPFWEDEEVSIGADRFVGHEHIDAFPFADDLFFNHFRSTERALVKIDLDLMDFFLLDRLWGHFPFDQDPELGENIVNGFEALMEGFRMAQEFLRPLALWLFRLNGRVNGLQLSPNG